MPHLFEGRLVADTAGKAKLVPVDRGGAVVQVLRVLGGEDERALPPPDLVEKVVVVVVVQPVLHQLAAHPHVGHLQRGRG